MSPGASQPEVNSSGGKDGRTGRKFVLVRHEKYTSGKGREQRTPALGQGVTLLYCLIYSRIDITLP